MEKLEVIVGERQEGKTTEMFEMYTRHYLKKYETVGGDGEIIGISNLRDSNKPIWLYKNTDTFLPGDVITKLIDTLDTNCLNSDEEKEIKSSIHYVYGVNSKEDIENIIKYSIQQHDCAFYIDDCCDLLTTEQAVNWISDLSCSDGCNSFDIIMTKLK